MVVRRESGEKKKGRVALRPLGEDIRDETVVIGVKKRLRAVTKKERTGEKPPVKTIISPWDEK